MNERGDDDDAALEIFRYAEEVVGDDRYAGAWIDRSGGRPTLGIALIGPSPEQVTAIESAACDAGWLLTIDVVKYSRGQLIAFSERLHDWPEGSAVSCGWDPRINKVIVTLSALDAPTVQYFTERIPADALMIRYVMGLRAQAL